MTGKVEVVTEAGVVGVRAPYDPSFAPLARAKGGDWDRGEKIWIFERASEAEVREICRTVYGTDGSTNSVVAVLLHLNSVDDGLHESLFLFGRQIAKRWAAGGAVRLDPTVTVLRGGFPSVSQGPSASLAPMPGTLLLIRDVAPRHADEQSARFPGAIEVVSGAHDDRNHEAYLARLSALVEYLNPETAFPTDLLDFSRALEDASRYFLGVALRKVVAEGGADALAKPPEKMKAKKTSKTKKRRAQ